MRKKSFLAFLLSVAVMMSSSTVIFANDNHIEPDLDEICTENVSPKDVHIIYEMDEESNVTIKSSDILNNEDDLELFENIAKQKLNESQNAPNRRTTYHSHSVSRVVQDAPMNLSGDSSWCYKTLVTSTSYCSCGKVLSVDQNIHYEPHDKHLVGNFMFCSKCRWNIVF